MLPNNTLYSTIILSLATVGLLCYFDLRLTFLQPFSIIHYNYLRQHKEQKQETIEYVKLRGLNYTPRKGPESLHDIQKECKNATEIQVDFNNLSQLTDYFHLYALAECSQARTIIPLAKKMGMKLFLNIWIGGSTFNSPTSSFALEMRELDYLLENQMINTDIVKAISVGSESYHRHETTIEENISYLRIVRDHLNRHNITDLPLTVTDIDKTFMQFPELMEAVDFASINAFPFFDTAYGKKEADGAVSYLNQQILDPLLDESRKMRKGLFLTETGWPQKGTDCSNAGIPCSEASVKNQIKYFVNFYCDVHLGKPSLQYFWFDGMDSSWRRKQDVSKDSVEGHFGILDDDGTMKEHFESLSFQCPVTIHNVTFKFPKIN